MSAKVFGLTQVSAVGWFFGATAAKCMRNTLSEDGTENLPNAQQTPAELSASQKGRLVW